MADWLFEFEGSTKISGKLLIGWNAAEEKIVSAVWILPVAWAWHHVLDSEAKTITETGRGVNGEGEECVEQEL